MEYIVNKKDLTVPLSLINDLDSKIISSAGSALFSFEQINNKNILRISGNDGDCFYSKNIDVIGEQSCKFWVVSKNIFPFVNSLTSEKLTIKPILLKDNVHRVSFKSSGYEVILPTINPESIIDEDTATPQILLQIPAKELSKIINYLRCCILDIRTRRNLSGLNISRIDGKWYFVATDSFRIGHCQQQLTVLQDDESQKFSSIIVPRKAVLKIIRIIEDTNAQEPVSLGFNNNIIHLKTTNSSFKAVLIADQYPDVSRFFNYQGSRNMKINITNLQESMKVFKGSADLANGKIKLKLESGNMLLSIDNDQVLISKKLDIEYDKEPMTINFNIQYFIDALYSFSSSEDRKLNLEFNSHQDPVKIWSEDDLPYQHILMPIKAN